MLYRRIMGDLPQNRRSRNDYVDHMKNATITTAPSTTATFDDGLRNLLSAWTAHDDLRRCGAPIAELAASNGRLFDSRLNARSLARAA